MRKLNDDLKRENEAHFTKKLELDEKISELEQAKMDAQRSIIKLKN